MKEKYIKAINFDLDTNRLKEVYPGKHYTKAYSDIKSFFKKNDFTHRQGSGYCSKKPMTDLKTIELIEKLSGKFPWLKNSVEKFDVTNIGKNHDMIFIFENEKAAESESILMAPCKDKTRPLSQWKADIEAVKAEREAPDGDVKTRIPTEKER